MTMETLIEHFVRLEMHISESNEMRIILPLILKENEYEKDLLCLSR